MNICVIGCGEVGGCYAQALHKAGHRMLVLCDKRAVPGLDALAATMRAAIETGVGDWIGQADLVINAVYGSVARDVARLALPLMRAGAVFADFTTADPEHMSEGAALAAQTGVQFVDVAITGAIAISGARTPLICAGQGTETIMAVMRSAGAPIELAGERAGDASNLKLLRSIFTKGVEALAVECLVAADKKGLRAELYEVLSDVDRMPLKDFMEACVRSHVVHARRRLNEVQQAKIQMRKSQIAPLVLDGVEALFQRTSDALAAKPDIDGTIEGSLQWLAVQAKSID